MTPLVAPDGRRLSSTTTPPTRAIQDSPPGAPRGQPLEDFLRDVDPPRSKLATPTKSPTKPRTYTPEKELPARRRFAGPDDPWQTFLAEFRWRRPGDVPPFPLSDSQDNLLNGRVPDVGAA